MFSVKKESQNQMVGDDVTKGNNKRIYVFLGCLILIQLIVIIFCFTVKKEAFHSDEIWSYGYANSYYQKDVFQNRDGTPWHANEWSDGQVLRDYVIVNDGEAFKYDSIYNNQIDDMSPPLHTMILHTICSFFPNKFSMWFGFSINIVAFVVCMIFLFKSASLLMEQSYALLVCIMYGFSRGTIDNFCYLRMYAMCAALTTVILYLMLKIIKAPDCKKYYKNGIALFLVSLVAFLTHFYMISLAGIMTALFCAYLLFSKQIKKMFLFGFTMLGSFLASIACFPSLLMRSSGQAASVAVENHSTLNYNFEIRFRLLSSFITKKNFCFEISMFKSNTWKEIIVCLLCLLIVVCPILFLFRKSPWFIKLKEKVIYALKNFKVVIVGGIIKALKKVNWLCVCIAIVCVLEMIVVGQTTNLYMMGRFEDRYLFNFVPMVVLVAVPFVGFVVKLIVRHKKAAMLIVCFWSAISSVGQLSYAMRTSDYYFEKNENGSDLKDIITDKNFVYMDYNKWIITALIPEVYDCKNYFLTDPMRYTNHRQEFIDKLSDGDMYLVINVADYENALERYNTDSLNFNYDGAEEALQKKLDEYNEIKEFFEDLVPETDMKLVSVETLFFRKTEIYLINP